MGQISVACYRPKPGKTAELEALASEHVPILQSRGLATERQPIIGRAKDGTIVEIFEWSSADAINRAHSDPEVQKLWEHYGAACDYVKLSDLAESSDLFAGFEALN
jgi:hypothetical protein